MTSAEVHAADSTVAAGADTAVAAGQAQVEQVVVTARRIEERLQDVPMSITVVSQRQLTNYNVSNASDLVGVVPALSADTRFGADASSFVIRGFSQDIGTSPTVGMYFADVVEARGGFGGTTIHAGEGTGPGDLFDLQNIQVLKGPQGTLFGRNTTGGAILLVPQKPTDEFGGYGELSFGDFGMERLQGVINIPVDEHLRLRFGMDQQTRDGYLDNISNIGPKDFANVNYYTFRISADADLAPNVENYTIFSYTNSDNNGTDTQLEACDPNAPLFGQLYCTQLAADKAKSGPYSIDNSLVNPRSYINEWRIINTTTWDVNNSITFKNIASYSQLKAITASELFADDFKSIFGIPLPNPLQFTAENNPPGIPLTHQASVTEEPRINGSAFDGRMTWQAGLYFEESYPIGLSGSSGPNLISCKDFQTFNQCLDIVGIISSLAPGACPLPANPFCLEGTIGNVGRRFGQVMWQDYGIYAQDTYNFTDELALTTGIRYSNDITSGTTTRYSYYFPTPFGAPVRFCEEPLPGSLLGGTGNCVDRMKQDSSAPTGLANLSYKVIDNVMLYAQYARGYRQGGLGSTFPIGFETFQPEHLNAYEGGVKSTFDWFISGYANAAFFYNDFSNQQVLGTFVHVPPNGAPPNAGILNVGSSRIYGIDLDSDFILTDHLSLAIGWTYLESKLLNVNLPTLSNPFYNVFGPNEPQGNMLALTPKNKLNVTPTYTLPIDPRYGTMALSMTYLFTSKQLVYGVGPYSHIPDTNVFNLNFNWENVFGGRFDTEFFMTNVTNLKYPSYIDNFINPPSSGAVDYGVIAEQLAPPRMYGFRLRVHF
jgi:iron complex outermembrane receptor protein